MVVIGYKCIYSTIEVISAPGLYPLNFYIVNHFTFKGKNKFVANDVLRILNTRLSFTKKDFLNMLSIWNLSPSKRQMPLGRV